MGVIPGKGLGMNISQIQNSLFTLKDEKFGQFNRKLIPTVDPNRVIGIKTPELRKLAKQISNDADMDVFLNALPHLYFEENQLHAFILSGLKDYSKCIYGVCQFLPYIDNWATCDQLSPSVFKKHKIELLSQIWQWIQSKHTYTVRFGIGMLMQHYLDEDFDIKYPQWISAIRSDEYYINMMIAWYFATALAKQYDSVLPFITQKKLGIWTHNKTIQKAIESYRISDEKKIYLKSLKVLRA